MPYTGELRNELMKKAGELAGFVGCYTAGTPVITWTQTSQKILKHTGHGLTTGMLVCLESQTGATGNTLVAGRFYYVKEVNANEIELSETSAFVAVEWEGTLTEAKICKFTEVSGAPYKRIATVWEAAAKSLVKDKTEHSVPMAEGTVVDAVSYHTLESAGTLECIEKVTKETVGASKAYVVKESVFDELS